MTSDLANALVGLAPALMANAGQVHGQDDPATAPLRAVMTRIGASMQPEAFVEAVARTYKLIKQQRYPTDMTVAFRGAESHAVFKEALAMARESANKPLAVLVLGCGPGYAGRGSDYALGVVQEVFAARDIQCLAGYNVSPEELRRGASSFPGEGLAGRFDLVVTHSLVHYIADPALVFEFIRARTATWACLVMAHEPNARFCRNANFVAARQQGQAARGRVRRLGRYLRPSRYMHKFAGLLGRQPGGSLHEDVSIDLRTRFGWKDCLTPAEINGIIDVHRVPTVAGEFHMGFPGLDWDQLQAAYLQPFRLSWKRTYNHLGDAHPRTLPRRRQEMETALRAAYPDEGITFSAVWRRLSDD